ncbi:MAG: replication initiator protein A [Roseburia sp.]
MKFEYIYGKQAEQYDYLYIPKAFMKEAPFKKMSASAKILYAVLMEKQQRSSEMGWIDENNHVFIMVTARAIASELNWEEADTIAAVEELERFDLLEIAEKGENLKLYLKRFV